MKSEKPLIGIIGGKGRMGNWFQTFFRKNGLTVIVSDINTKLSNIELAEKADIVIVSVPIQKTVKVIREIRPFLRKEALLTDFTSIKSVVLKEMSKAKCGVLGIHPLFGPLAPNLENQIIVFCRSKNNHWVTFLKNLFQKNKGKVLEIKAEEHDRQAAFIQALLHFHNLGYAHLFSRENFKPLPEFLTPVFKLQSLVLGRILSQDPSLYASIEMENPYFLKILESYYKQIGEFKKVIEKKDYKEFENLSKRSQLLFSDFIQIAQKRSSEVLKMMEKKPIKIGKPKKIIIKKAKVGFLGPEGTFSWVAAKNILPSSISLFPFRNIKEVFRAVSDEEIDLGVVPIENRIGGLVSETMHSFVDFPVFTVGSFNFPISHCLASRGKKLKEIKIVKSHPQALAQCKDWLSCHLPKAIKESTSSTIAPVIKDFSKETAFVVSLLAAKKFKLNVLASGIEDSRENFTRFFIITSHLNKKILEKFKAKNTLLLLSIYDRVGVLRDILTVFADKNINLSALHSISSYSHPWDYLFFLEIEKSYFSREMKATLKKLEKYCPYIKVIGVV